MHSLSLEFSYATQGEFIAGATVFVLSIQIYYFQANRTYHTQKWNWDIATIREKIRHLA
jgi:hypothetical protein